MPKRVIYIGKGHTAKATRDNTIKRFKPERVPEFVEPHEKNKTKKSFIFHVHISKPFIDALSIMYPNVPIVTAIRKHILTTIKPIDQQ